MNDVNSNKLYKEFPNFFPKRYFEFAIGDGWFSIFYALCKDLEPLVKDAERPFMFLQVKEKFGDLRMYTGGDINQEIKDLLQLAREKAATTCDQCGNLGTWREDNWCRVRCDIHAV